MAGGRPSKLTPQVKKKLLDAIRAGNYYEPACMYAGISYRSFRRWMDKGEKAKSGEFWQFCQEVKQAEAEAEARVVAMWQKQIPDSWQAARDFLERRYPDRWGRREKIDLSGEVKQKHEYEYDITHQIIGDQDTFELANALARALASKPSRLCETPDEGQVDMGETS